MPEGLKREYITPYVYREYPKSVDGVIVNSAEEEAQLKKPEPKKKKA